MRWTSEGLADAGFEGFVRFSELPAASVPTRPGVYAVLRGVATVPEFLEESRAGRFQGRDPTVHVQKLRAAWRDGAEVLYVGMASGGKKGKRHLKTRLDEYRRHGVGEPVAHWGGRYLWQIGERDSLLVAWRESGPDAEDIESQLLDDFASQFGGLPFANRKRGRRIGLQAE